MNLKLSKAARSDARWAWKEGMRAQRIHDDGNIYRVLDTHPLHDDPRIAVVAEDSWFHDDSEYLFFPDEVLPDLDDPATRGCLLQHVRHLYGHPYGVVLWEEALGRWEYRSRPDKEAIGTGDTEEKALVAALERAPLPSAQRS